MDKPKLPSIESMLQGATAAAHTRDDCVPYAEHQQPVGMTMSGGGHRRHASLSDNMLFTSTTTSHHPRLEMSVATHGMQKLTITQPAAPIEPRLDEPPLLLTPPPRHHQQQRSTSSSSRNTHMRSFSDFSHPYPDVPFIPPSSSSSHSNHSHRRAISTNSLDFILQRGPPPFSSSMAEDEHPDEEDEEGLANNSSDDDHPGSMATMMMTTPTTLTTSSSGGSTKYHCPYCDKGFSRPSSLRIHTYSHTGEKPFVCTEPGCSRKFSVQSNMRRHLRVHAKRAVWPDQHHHRFSLASSTMTNQQHQHG
ncbi:predicted protein [Lichtheimia corymbifera JMRC:FSU:9682]|uniref:C2H2-type domain-containing protein n=1 Tax=Lichtheimia corymbifera JMRC:FSU:9682 TaxID=1263082 RepID=A0A068RP33_9FUNG|nr:predicted protein [Lichtheimia corymbifera JMRC:FSU:9682]